MAKPTTTPPAPTAGTPPGGAAGPPPGGTSTSAPPPGDGGGSAAPPPAGNSGGGSPIGAPPSKDGGGGPTILVAGDAPPQVGPVPAQIYNSDGELSAAGEQDPAQVPVATKEVLNQIKEKIDTVFNETSITPDGIWLSRSFTQMYLLHLNTPPTLQLLAHTPNAGTLLLAAVDNMLAKVAAIRAVDPKAFKGIDLEMVARQRDVLAGQREIYKAFSVAAHCVEAGMSHSESYLDSVVRLVWTRARSEINGDFLLQQDLTDFIRLNTISPQIGQETKHNIAVVQHETEAETLARAGKQQGQGSTGAQGQGTTGQQGGGTTTPGSSLPDPQHPMPPRRKPRPGSPAKPARPPRPRKASPKSPKG